VAKSALAVFAPLALVNMKYTLGFVVLFAVKCCVDRRFPLRKQDIPIMALCAVFGQLLYFACEYGAMSYLPVSLISIVLAFVPAVSVLAEFLLFRRRANRKVVIGMAVGIIGVVMVIGGDFSGIGPGAAIGYLLSFGAVICWNVYNFVTTRLTNQYKPFDLTIYQTCCTALISLPFLLRNMPDWSLVTGEVVLSLCFLGLICEGIGFIIFVNALAKLGPTPVAMFSNMLPVTTTFFGWLLLGEHIGALQLAGGAIVVACGVLVLREKDRLDTTRLVAEHERHGRE